MNIVFIHLNALVPKFLQLNIERTCKLFPKNKIFLLTDQVFTNSKLPNLNVINIDLEEKHILLESTLSHPKNFRNNFGFLCVVRLMLFEKFMVDNYEPFLHVESDVIISDDFPFEKILNLEAQIAYPVVNSSHSISSCIFIRNHATASLLSNFTLAYAQKHPLTDDMEVLSNFRRSYPDIFQLLPTVPSNESALLTKSVGFKEENTRAIEIFKGFFDGYDLGRYLIGDDPRNFSGKSRVRYQYQDSELNIRSIEFKPIFGRSFPGILIKETSHVLPVYSLHIHSKKIKFFKKFLFSYFINKAVKKSEDKPKIVYNVRLTIKSIPTRFSNKIKSYYKSRYDL